jgi:hypothetical protein
MAHGVRVESTQAFGDGKLIGSDIRDHVSHDIADSGLLHEPRLLSPPSNRAQQDGMFQH